MSLGKVIIGHSLDCRREPIERWLKNYDAQLYLKWNPKKNDGRGLWEVRRRPTRKTAVFQGELPDGTALIECKYVESSMVHHVLDSKILDWSIPARIREMDTQGIKNWAAKAEENGEAWLADQTVKNRSEMQYSIRQHKKSFKVWMEDVARGQNPGMVLNKFKP